MRLHCRQPVAAWRPAGLAALPASGRPASPVLPHRRHTAKQQQHVQLPSRGSSVAPHAGLDVAALASTAPSTHDVAMFFVAALGAKLWTKLFDLLVSNGVLEQVRWAQ